MVEKKTQQETSTIRMVEQHKASYKGHEFARSEDRLSAESVAEGLGIEKGRIFKTLITVGGKTGSVVAVIPGNQELDLKKLTEASGSKKVRMLHLKDLETTIGHIRGGYSPIGVKRQFPIYLAEETRQYSAIIVPTGKRGIQIELAPEAILSLTSGQLTEITTRG